MLLKEPIPHSFGAQQLVNEQSRGDEVIHPETASRMQTCLLNVLADLIPRSEPVCRNDCKRTEDTILNERIARTHGFPEA